MGSTQKSPHDTDNTGDAAAKPEARKATEPPEASDEKLDEALEESFPASDPPSECQPSPSPYDKDEI